MRRERITVTLRGDLIKQLDLLVNGKDVKNRSNAIEHLIIDRFQSRSLKKAVIVGRTHDLTLDGKEIAKVLIPISGKTLIEKNIQTLSRIGI
ncbi:MAG TPA: hypothetical protein VK255_04220, partial [Patescibacteria group bacterium]|nr:hypothetical protein [Patescibacteria group bacterium]